MGEKDTKAEGGEKKNDGGAKDSGPVVVKVDLHCEGCAKKIKKSVKSLEGVESVHADSATNKLTVKGKVDPSRVLERVQSKTNKKVELISPKKDGGGGDKKSGGGGDEKKSEEKSDKKPDEKKKEPQATTVVMKIRLHCDGCIKKIRKIIRKYKGVENVTIDEQKDLVTVKGTMDIKSLQPYLKEKLKRSVDIIPPKKEEGDKKGGDGGGEKKKEGGDGGGDKKEKAAGGGGEKKEGGGGGGGDGKAKGGDGEKKEGQPKVEVNKMEYYPYPHGYGYEYGSMSGYGGGYGNVTSYGGGYGPPNGYGGGYGYGNGFGQENVVPYVHNPHVHAPQIFSDENPNACSIM